MNYFDSLIEEVDLLKEPLRQKVYEKTSPWNDLGRNEVILQRETAYELDGVGFNLVTTKDVSDEIILLGDDLSEVKSNRKFARISIIQLEETYDEQKAYNLIKKVEYVKYHHFPEGYMIRTASRSHKEVVRVSKTALKEGISFQKVGSLLIEKHRENPLVKGVKVIFITAKEADYKKLEALANKNTAITETLNRIMNNVTFDCDSCNLKPICDEVEGLKELHKSQGMF